MVREGVSGDVSWYPKVRGGARRHRVDACAVLLMKTWGKPAVLFISIKGVKRETESRRDTHSLVG